MPLHIDKIGVSDVTFPRSPWRYLLVFQSWSQFQSWVFFVIVTNILINFLLAVADSQILPLEGILIGTIVGSSCSLIMVLPTRLIISLDSRYGLSELVTEIEKLGYILLDSKSGITIYQQNLPRVLRWDEGNVEIKRADDFLIVEGPLMILKKIRKSL